MRMCFLSLLLLLPLTAWSGDLVFKDATVRVPMPGKERTSAYFLVENPGDEPRTLVGIEADIAGRAELHRHETEEGMMRMRRVKAVEIPAGGEVRFSSGGYHVMLFELERRPRTGDPLQLTVEFEDGSHQTLEARAVSVFDESEHSRH